MKVNSSSHTNVSTGACQMTSLLERLQSSTINTENSLIRMDHSSWATQIESSSSQLKEKKDKKPSQRQLRKKPRRMPMAKVLKVM